MSAVPALKVEAGVAQDRDYQPYREAGARVRAWLDAHFTADGSFTPDPHNPKAYYKAPYLLTMAGLRAKGARVARRVLERYIGPDGQLQGPPAFDLEQRVYGMGWLALGATVTERFDLAAAVCRRLIALQDPRSGGVPLPDADAGEEVAEVCFSAGGGMGLAAAGRIEPARLMANRLAALLDAQPQPGRYYNRFRRDGSVVAKPAAGAWEKMYDLAQDEQRPANYATVVSQLVWTARATGGAGRGQAGNRSYYAAAERYVDLVYAHRQDPAQFGRATKFGWAMLQLYEDTGDPRLLARARAMGDVLVSRQDPDGMWEPRPPGRAPAAPADRLSYSSDCAVTVLALAALPTL